MEYVGRAEFLDFHPSSLPCKSMYVPVLLLEPLAEVVADFDRKATSIHLVIQLRLDAGLQDPCPLSGVGTRHDRPSTRTAVKSRILEYNSCAGNIAQPAEWC